MALALFGGPARVRVPDRTRVAIVPVTLPQDFILNSPFIIAAVTVFSCLIWLLVAPAVAGEAAARDVQTGMHPLIYTSPVSKADYLGGRFLAAFVLNALILLGVQVGILLAVYAPGVDPEIIGPFRPAAYLTAYGFIALPNAFIATAIQFSVGAAERPADGELPRQPAPLLPLLSGDRSLCISRGSRAGARAADRPDRRLRDHERDDVELDHVEKNVRLFTLEGPMLWNRLLWLGIALATLAFTYLRFRFAHRTRQRPGGPAARDGSGRSVRERRAESRVAHGRIAICRPARAPDVRLRDAPAPDARDCLVLVPHDREEPGRAVPARRVPVMLGAGAAGRSSEHWGVPLLPRTGYVLTKYLTAPLTQIRSTIWVIVPLLIIFFAGELVWRERDARLSENVDATPVPEWVLFLGKFLGLALVLVALMAVADRWPGCSLR